VVGFDMPGVRGRRVDLPLSDAGLIARAVREKASAVIREEKGSDAESWTAARPAFAATDDARATAALPLMLGHRTVAVVYADTPADAAPPEWSARLEMLVRCARLVLEARTVEYAAGLRAIPGGGRSTQAPADLASRS